MNRETQFAKNTLILSLGHILPRLVSLITLPIITGFLTKSEMGTYDLVHTLISLIMPICTLQIHSAAFRYLIESRKNLERSRNIISSIVFFSFPIALCVSVIIFIVYPGVEFPLKFAISSYFFIDCINITLNQVIRGLGHNKVYSIGSIILSIVNGFCIVISVKHARLALYGVFYSALVANTASIIYLSVRINIREFVKPASASKKTIKELLSYSWPMIPNNLSTWVLKLSDRVVITAFLGIEQNAVYSVANRIPNLLHIGQSVMMMAWQENASLAVNDKDASEYYSKMFDTMFSLMAGLTALLIGFTPLLFRLLIRGDYNESYGQMPILFLGAFFACMSAFQGGIYIAHKKTVSVGITTIVAAVINLAIDLLFVNVIGITAGSLSTLVAYFVLYAYRLIDCKKIQPMTYKIRKQVVCIVILAGMLILCSHNHTALNMINIFAGLVMVTVLNYDLIQNIIKRIRMRLQKK